MSKTKKKATPKRGSRPADESAARRLPQTLWGFNHVALDGADVYDGRALQTGLAFLGARLLRFPGGPESNYYNGTSDLFWSCDDDNALARRIQTEVDREDGGDFGLAAYGALCRSLRMQALVVANPFLSDEDNARWVQSVAPSCVEYGSHNDTDGEHNLSQSAYTLKALAAREALQWPGRLVAVQGNSWRAKGPQAELAAPRAVSYPDAPPGMSLAKLCDLAKVDTGCETVWLTQWREEGTGEVGIVRKFLEICAEPRITVACYHSAEWAYMTKAPWDFLGRIIHLFPYFTSTQPGEGRFQNDPDSERSVYVTTNANTWTIRLE